MWSLQQAPRLADDQIDRWCQLLETRTGVRLPMQQHNLVQAQVSMRMRELDIDDGDEYFHFVRRGIQGAMEWNILVDRLVVKETGFYRHRESMNAARDFLLETISSESRQSSLEMWSVGCSTGEEAYSLAMIASDCFNFVGKVPYFGITGIDISLSALHSARKGRYAAHRLYALNKYERDQHFTEVEDGRFFQISEQIRERVCFSQANLSDASTLPPAKLDLICCQNLLIYFRRWRRKEVLDQLVERLRPGGLLIIGLGEIVNWQHPKVEKLDDSSVQAYRRC